MLGVTRSHTAHVIDPTLHHPIMDEPLDRLDVEEPLQCLERPIRLLLPNPRICGALHIWELDKNSHAPAAAAIALSLGCLGGRLFLAGIGRHDVGTALDALPG